MNQTDELLNKYLDGELSPEGLDEVNELLQLEENVKKLKALQIVENTVKKFDTDLAPAGFTSRVMDKISLNSVKTKIRKDYLSPAINVIFILAILATFLFAFSMVSWKNPGLDSKVEVLVKSVSGTISGVLSMFETKSFMLFGSLFSLVILIGVYYLFEAHKSFKKRIENFSTK